MIGGYDSTRFTNCWDLKGFGPKSMEKIYQIRFAHGWDPCLFFLSDMKILRVSLSLN